MCNSGKMKKIKVSSYKGGGTVKKFADGGSTTPPEQLQAALQIVITELEAVGATDIINALTNALQGSLQPTTPTADMESVDMESQAMPPAMEFGGSVTQLISKLSKSDLHHLQNYANATTYQHRKRALEDWNINN